MIAAERHTCIDALETEIKFGTAPQDFLDIDRILASPNLNACRLHARPVVLFIGR